VQSTARSGGAPPVLVSADGLVRFSLGFQTDGRAQQRLAQQRALPILAGKFLKLRLRLGKLALRKVAGGCQQQGSRSGVRVGVLDATFKYASGLPPAALPETI
jgi:hypothetical protein